MVARDEQILSLKNFHVGLNKGLPFCISLSCALSLSLSLPLNLLPFYYNPMDREKEREKSLLPIIGKREREAFMPTNTTAMHAPPQKLSEQDR